jgi:hypothetical protein
MTQLFKLFVTIAGIALSAASLCAQQSPRIPTDSVVRPSTTVSSGTYTPSTLVMIESRARTLGNRPSASGTRYFAVTDADLIGKTPDEVLKRLSPPVITAVGGLRQIDVVVDLQRPITLFPTADQPANVGTAVVQSSGFNNIAVNSIIAGAQLTVIPKNKE